MQVPYLLGGEILHASGHLVGARDQVLGGELLLGVVAGVVAVFQPRRPPGLQVLPEVALGGILHDDVQRTWGAGCVDGEAIRPVRRFRFTWRKPHTQWHTLPKFPFREPGKFFPLLKEREREKER